MKGYKPDGGDFNFVSNGYKCAIGINTDGLDAGGEDIMIILTKQKTAGGEDQSFQDWELVHYLYIHNRQDEDLNSLMAEFLAEANPKLKAATGGEAPPVPATFLEKAKHLCRYGLAFNTSTGEVYIK